MKPRSPIARMSKKKLKMFGSNKVWSTISTPKKAVRKKPRSKSEFQRIYGSKERVLFVKGLACCACGVVGYSENAHVPPKGEAGTGYKADAKWIVALCDARRSYAGCHRWLHNMGRQDFEGHFRLDLEKCAEETEAAWQSRISEREE